MAMNLIPHASDHFSYGNDDNSEIIERTTRQPVDDSVCQQDFKARELRPQGGTDATESELSGFTDVQRVQVQQHACETMLAINSHNSDSLLRRVHAGAAFLLKNPLFLLSCCLRRRHLIRRGVLGSVGALGTLLGLR